MKPGDHPEFFRFPAPEGRSRESTIRLDANGTFFHDGEKVEHVKLAAAMHAWISRHPDDGRYILTNGYDWTYFTVEDAPYHVCSIRIEHGSEGDSVALLLSDSTEEEWNAEGTRAGTGNVLYTQVKRDAPWGPFEARFTRHAQTALGPLLVDETERGKAGSRPAVRLKNRTFRIG